MNAQKQLARVLRLHGFELVRQRRQFIYRNANGKIFVTAATPSDRRATQNQLAQLKRIIAVDPVR